MLNVSPRHREDVQWLGEIPDNWSVCRNIGLFSETKIIGHPKETLLSVTIENGIIPQSENELKRDSSNEDKSKYKLVEVGDLAYNKMRMWQGAIGRAHQTGIVSPAYVTLRPVDRRYSGYFHYLYRTPAFIAEANRHSYGLCDDMNSLRYEDFKSIVSPVPPVDVAQRIVAFLDEKTAEIDQAIEKKKKLIELLNEQKTILINNAVTKGLNPNVPMKDSGVEWIGDIPEHWGVVPLRWYVRIRSGDFLDSALIDSEPYDPRVVPVVGGNGVTGYAENSNFSGQTFVIGRVGALCGNVHLFDGLVWVTDNALVLSHRENFLSKYLADTLRALNLNKLANRSAQPVITGSMVKRQFVPMPTTDEQADIMNFCDRMRDESSSVISNAEKQIQLLTEYKQTLIANAVTGKIRV